MKLNFLSAPFVPGSREPGPQAVLAMRRRSLARARYRWLQLALSLRGRA